MKVTGLKQLIFSKSCSDAGNGAAANDFRIDGTLCKFPFLGPVVLQWIVTRTAGSSTTDLSLMVSLDGGTTYSSLVAFTQITGASGNEVKSINLPAGALVKTDINMGSSTTSTVKLYVCGAVLGGAGK